MNVEVKRVSRKGRVSWIINAPNGSPVTLMSFSSQQQASEWAVEQGHVVKGGSQ